MEIVSSTNQRVKNWAKLHQKKVRDEMRRFLVEGEHLITEALQANLVETLLIEIGHKCSYFGPEIIEVSSEVLKKLSQNVSQVHEIAVCRMPVIQNNAHNKVILLDSIQDPGNVGTIIRTAYSFGFNQLYLSKDCADVYSDKCLRSSQGACFHVDTLCCDLVDKIQTLKQAGFMIVGTDLSESKMLGECEKSALLGIVFGNEGQGISKEVLKSTSFNCRIEMEQFESLNVAVAAGICLYHFR